MPELKVEDVKKDLAGLVDKEKAEREKTLPKDQQDKLAEDKKKTEDARIAAEAQAKKDAELLAKKDEEIKDEAEKKRKTELLEKQRKEEEEKGTSEEKIKRIKDESQKRIDEISNELKQIKDKTPREIEELRKENEILSQNLKNLEKKLSGPKDESLNEIVEKEESERQAKYLQDDKSLPKEKRREMPDDELDEWMLEDAKSAVAWINRREMRRAQEKGKTMRTKTLEKMAGDIAQKQQQSFQKVYIKHPELDVRKRGKELEAQGKTGEEIHNILQAENPKYKLSAEIASKHPEWAYLENLPELIAAEMDKEPEKSPVGNDEDKKKIEDLTKQVEEMSAKLAELENSDEGVHSTIVRNKAKEALSEKEKNIVDIMKEQKATQAQIDAAIKQSREKNARSTQ